MIKRISLFIFIILLVLLAAGIFTLLRIAQSPERVQDVLTAQIQDGLGTRLSFQEARFGFSPFPILKAKQPRIESSNEEFPSLMAKEAQFSFRFLPLLWGQIQLSGIRIREAEGIFGGIPLQRIEFKVTGLQPKRFAPFEWKARGKKGKEVLKGSGSLSLGNPGENFWKGGGLQGDVTLHSFSLADEMEAGLLKRLPPALQSSEWNGTLHFDKAKRTDAVEGLVQFEAKNLHSENSGAFSLTGESKFVWNFENHLLEFKHVALKTPFGKLDGTGVFNVETGEIKEARLVGRKMVLEELIRFFPPLNALLPLDTGFSGESEFDLTLRGTMDYLSLHANWNLTPAVLTYGRVFSKPKDFPMAINFDFLLKEGSSLSGDLSTRIGETTVKGALVNLDLKTGVGEITFLTNKFELEGWSGLLIPFTHYQMRGLAKVLLSLKGNLTQIHQAEKMWNLTLEGTTLLSPTGRGIQEASGHFDVSPLNLRIKNAVFKVGDSSIQIQLDIYNFQESPQGTLQILSPRVDPSVLLENSKELGLSVRVQKILASWPKIEGAIISFFPKGAFLEDFTLNLEIQPTKLVLQKLECQALGGSVQLHGEKDQSSEKPSFWLEAQLDQISLARYFEGTGRANEALEGNLFFTGKFQAQAWKPGEISKAITGHGAVSITNGEWHALDPIGPLKDLGEFQSLLSYRSPSTSFYDLKASWNYKEGRFDTEDFLIHSEDFWMEGKGNLTLRGVLNSRLEVYLSKFLTERVFKSWQAADKTDGKQLGPFSFLLVGDLTKPELRIDDRSLEPLMDAIRTRRFRKVLREPFKG